MTIDFNKPTGGPSPALDCSTIQSNFKRFSDALVINHIALNSFSAQGDHRNVIFTNQTDIPEVSKDSAILFSINATSNAGVNPQLFARIPKFLPNNIANSPMQLTYNTVNITGPNQYQSFLVGGYLIYFGRASGSADKSIPISQTITLATPPSKLLVAFAIPNTTAMTGSNFDQSIPYAAVITSGVNNKFDFVSNGYSNGPASLPYSFTWMAIGTV